MEEEKFLYRYEIKYGLGRQDQEFYIATDVALMKYKIYRETQSSYFIRPKLSDDKLKRVAKFARATFAYTSKEKAKENFIKRTEKRIEILKFFKSECKKALKVIKNPNFNK